MTTPNRRVANPAIVASVTGSDLAEDIDAEVAALWTQISNFLGVVGGSANVLTGSCPVPLIGSYVVGNTFEFVTGAVANTGAVTLNVDTKGAVAVVTPAGVALTSGQLEANTKYRVTYNGTSFVLEGGFFDVVVPRMDLIGSWTYSSAVSSFSFSGLGGYRDLRVLFQGLSGPNSGPAALYMDVSTDNGTTWITTGAQYMYCQSGGIPTVYNNNILCLSGSSGNSTVSGLLHIFDFNQGLVPYWDGKSLTSTVSDASPVLLGYMNNNYTLNALRFRLSTGNFDGGTVKLYGMIG